MEWFAVAILVAIIALLLWIVYKTKGGTAISDFLDSD